MKVLEKILLMIILIVTINFCIMPITVNAYNSASEAITDISKQASNGSTIGQNWLNEHNLSAGTIINSISWVSAIVWIIFIACAVIGGLKRAWPAAMAILTGKEASQSWTTIIIYIVLVVLAFIVLFNLFPLIVTTDWEA